MLTGPGWNDGNEEEIVIFAKIGKKYINIFVTINKTT